MCGYGTMFGAMSWPDTHWESWEIEWGCGGGGGRPEIGDGISYELVEDEDEEEEEEEDCDDYDEDELQEGEGGIEGRRFNGERYVYTKEQERQLYNTNQRNVKFSKFICTF